MDQIKIGKFLKELRKENGLTQEKLAEMLGVSNRSVSRWENGVNMPDFDLVIELANYYNVSTDEILDGERKNNMIDKESENTMLKIAEYENNEKQKFSKRICRLFVAAIIAFAVYGVLEIMELTTTNIYEQIASFSLGIVFGTLLVGALYTSRYMTKIRSAKLRLLNKIKHK